MSFLQLISTLQKEQEAEEIRDQTSPALAEAQERLRAEYERDGIPCLERLKALAGSDDFKGAVAAGSLDFDKFALAGVNHDLIEGVRNNLRELISTHNGTLRCLQMIPTRISHLEKIDVERGRYKDQPSVAEQISKDIRSAPGNIREISLRIEAIRHGMERIAQHSHKVMMSTWTPEARWDRVTKGIGIPTQPRSSRRFENARRHPNR